MSNDDARTFVVTAGFDDNGDGGLGSTEATRRVEVHVVRPDLDTDSDNNRGTALPHRDAAEEAFEAFPPGKFVILNDDDDDENNTRDLTDSGPAAGENDLVPVVLVTVYRPADFFRRAFSDLAVACLRPWTVRSSSSTSGGKRRRNSSAAKTGTCASSCSPADRRCTTRIRRSTGWNNVSKS